MYSELEVQLRHLLYLLQNFILTLPSQANKLREIYIKLLSALGPIFDV